MLEDANYPDSETTDYLQLDPHNLSAAPQCPRCRNYLGMMRWEPPLRVELKVWGERFGDVAFGPGGDLLVSDRFRKLWNEQGLVGFEGFDPVEVAKVRRRRPPKCVETPPTYFRVTAVQSEVAIDQSKSGMQWTENPTCDVCRLGRNLKGRDRIVLEGEPTENVFLARGLAGVVLADERFRAFVEKHQFVNCPLIPGDQASRWY